MSKLIIKTIDRSTRQNSTPSVLIMNLGQMKYKKRLEDGRTYDVYEVNGVQYMVCHSAVETKVITIWYDKFNDYDVRIEVCIYADTPDTAFQRAYVLE